MAIDTQNKRRSAQFQATGSLRPVADGAITSPDRATAAWFYAGLNYAGAVTYALEGTIVASFTFVGNASAISVVGAFPSTPIIDRFDRADYTTGNVPGTDWTAKEGDLELIGQQLKGRTTAENFAVYNTVFNENQEVYITISTVPTSYPAGVSMFGRYNNSTLNGYDFQFTIGNTGQQDRLRWLRCDAGDINNPISSIYYFDAQDGDKIGARYNGSVLEGWLKPVGGEWTKIATLDITDSTYVQDGQFGFGCYGNTGTYDDFGGGAIPTALLSGNISIQSTFSGETKEANSLVGSCPVTTTFTGNLLGATTESLDGNIGISFSIAGAASIRYSLAANLPVSVSLTGELTVDNGTALAGTIATHFTFLGALSTNQILVEWHNTSFTSVTPYRQCLSATPVRTIQSI